MNLSIVIPLLNEEESLLELHNWIVSVMKANQYSYEVLFIDDGSTDDTSIRIAPFLKSGNEINYIRQQSQGATGAKNAGIQLSKGKYITFLDSDDEYLLQHC